MPAAVGGVVRRPAGVAAGAIAVGIAAVVVGSGCRRPGRSGSGCRVDLTLMEFLTRSYHDRDETLAGVEVRLVGFVLGDPSEPDGCQLTRFRMSCCAADAVAVGVDVRGLDGARPPDDTWVEVSLRMTSGTGPAAVMRGRCRDRGQGSTTKV
jgi:uncharacterized repeat protein (TIGR03943 family)